MDAAIIFEKESTPLAAALAEALAELGLLHGTSDTLTGEVLDALNVYREANLLIPLDFADPNALRALGIPASKMHADGDEVLSLAAYAEAHADTEVGMFDTCCRVLKLCRAHSLTVYEYTKMSGHAGVSPAAVTAAMLAFLN